MSLQHRGRVLTLLGLVTVACLVLHVFLGSYESLSLAQSLHEIFRGPVDAADPLNSTVWQIRLPRALECLAVGGLLGVVGSAFQALLRNPLADPYTVGVSSGSAVGGALAMVLGVGAWFGNLGVAGAGFVSGMGTLWLVYRLAAKRGVVDVRTLLLGGVVIGSLFSSLLMFIIYVAGQDERVVLGWLMGDTTRADWPRVGLLAVSLVIGFCVLSVETRRLNAFALGEDAAQRLGVDVSRLTKIVLITGGAMTAAAVGTVGIIGFLGLASPHIARRLVGVDWRWSLGGSLVVGSLLLLAADILAQRGVGWLTHQQGMEIPVGIVTSMLGAPSLLILLRKVGQG